MAFFYIVVYVRLIYFYLKNRTSYMFLLNNNLYIFNKIIIKIQDHPQDSQTSTHTYNYKMTVYKYFIMYINFRATNTKHRATNIFIK